MKVLISILVLILTSACAAPGGGFFTKPVYVTNTVVMPPVTNTVTQVLTQQVSGATQIVTNTIDRVVTQSQVQVVTNWIPNPALEQFTRQAQAINSQVNPTPTAPLINWGLSGLLGIASIVAAWKNKKATAAEDTIRTVIGAVETFPGGAADALKKHIETHAVIDGTEAHLAARVTDITGKL